MPDDVCHALMLATMTGLQKRDGGVRGIATGTSFRRLVAKVLARQFSDAVEATCAPFQFALSTTRAGTDCVGHAVRVATELNPRLTVLSIDAVGAYDHIFRSAMLSKVAEVPSLQGLLPFVKKAYARPSSYVWTDEAVTMLKVCPTRGLSGAEELVAPSEPDPGGHCRRSHSTNSGGIGLVGSNGVSEKSSHHEDSLPFLARPTPQCEVGDG